MAEDFLIKPAALQRPRRGWPTVVPPKPIATVGGSRWCPSSESQSWCLLNFPNCWVCGRYIEVVTMDLWFIKRWSITGEISLPDSTTLWHPGYNISYGTSPCWNMLGKFIYKWKIIDTSMKQWLKTLVRFQLVALDHTIGLWVLSSLLTPFCWSSGKWNAEPHIFVAPIADVRYISSMNRS